MSRCGYSDDLDPWQLIKWRGQVASALRGKRGQAFLNALRDALDAMPEKQLIANDLQATEGVCALGSIGKARGLDLAAIDPEDEDHHKQLAGAFDVAHQLIQEVEFMNDEGVYRETPAQRWDRMRRWVDQNVMARSAEPRNG